MHVISQCARLTVLVVGMTAGLALPAASAFGATIAVDPAGTLVFSAAAGTMTNVAIDRNPPGGTSFLVVRDTTGGSGVTDNDPITPGAGCSRVGGGGTTFSCTGAQRVSATLLDLTDRFDASEAGVPAAVDAGVGDDSVSGGVANDALTGGDGRDSLFGSGGDDTIDGGAADDFEDGGTGNDTVDGGAGDDFTEGSAGNDTLRGGAGDDVLVGGDGTDLVSGDDGDDFLSNFNVVVVNPSPGTEARVDTGDVYDGGGGFDALSTGAAQTDGAAFTTVPRDLTVTLDDQANDGIAGEGDNVRTTVERVSSQTFVSTLGGEPAGGNDTLVGSDGVNDLSGGLGNDRVDGGRGNDVLAGNAGDDTMEARDGFADFVTCGAGNDTANVDTLDQVSPDCETVNRVDVGNANEDRPPTIALNTPADNATLSTRTPTTLTATVSDDKGIARVLYLVNGRVVCTATAPPYSCSYRPAGSDVGRTAISAIAIDTSQQTATVVKTVNIGLFKPVRVSETVTPSRDRRAPFRFSARGKITLPATVTAAQGCSAGVVSVQVKVGSKTVSTRRAKLSKACTYRTSVAFRNRKRFGRATRLKFTARFSGNKVLTQAASSSRRVRIR